MVVIHKEPEIISKISTIQVLAAMVRMGS